MTLAVAFDLDPNNPDNALVLWGDGHVFPKGDAIDPHFYAHLVPPVGKAIQVTDWTTPSGYVLDGFGGVHNFGAALAPTGSFGGYSSGYDFYRGFSMDPAGNGRGYVCRLDGYIAGIGGLNDIGAAQWPGKDLARGFVMKWDTSGTTPQHAYYLLDAYGGLHACGGAKAWAGNDTSGYQVGRDIARGVMVVDWESPSVYWLEGNGIVHRGRTSLPDTARTPWWPDFSPAEAIRPVSESPFVYTILDWNAVLWKESPSTPPTVTITSPAAAATVSTTTRPSVTWALSDAQGDPVDHVDVRLFAASVLGPGDPKSSAGAVFSAQIVGSSNLGATSDVSVPDGSYVWAVWATEQVTALQSAAATVNFTMGVGAPGAGVVPGAPTVAAAPSTSDVAVTLTLTPAAAPPAGAIWEINYSDDGGVTWLALPGTSSLPASTPTWNDRTARSGVPRTYRARMDLPVQAIAGAWSIPVSAILSVAARPGYWLSQFDGSVWGPAMELKVSDLTQNNRVTAGVFDALGERNAVVVRDVPKGDDGTLDVWALSGPERVQFEGIVLSGDTLLLRDHFGHAWFLQVTDKTTHALVPAAPLPGESTPLRDAQKITVTWTEVDPPT